MYGKRMKKTPKTAVVRRGKTKPAPASPGKMTATEARFLAFDQARLEWPCFVWIWAELRSNGPWEIKHA
jgi:hypothetical protein